MKKRYILFVDNDIDFLNTRSEFIRDKFEDIQIIPTGSINEARKTLEGSYIHVAIIDVRLTDEENEKDTSGLSLAHDPKFRPIPKIILTAYPSYEAARKALEPAPDRGLPPAVAFLSKTESLEKFIQTIQEVLDRYVRINEDLAIYWQHGGSFRYLLELIAPEIEENRLLERAEELEDLFRKLFYENEQLTMGRILRFEKGQADVEMFAHGGKKSGSYVISVGIRDIIEEEREHYQRFEPRKLKKGVTHFIGSEETMRFGANLYHLIEGDVETMEGFASFYRRSQEAKPIQKALNYLFHHTLARFYERGRASQQGVTLGEAFPDWKALLEPSDVGSFAEKIQRVCEIAFKRNLGRIEAKDSSIVLHLSETDPLLLPNPARTANLHEVSFRQPLLYAAHHGRLRPDAILVDPLGATWVIHLRHVRQGPVLRDFVCLEESLLTELAGEISLPQLYAILDALFSGEEETSLSPAGMSEQQKLFATSNQLQSIAREIADADFQALHLGLLVCTLARLHTFDVQKKYYTRQEILPFVRALLIAGMLLERLITNLNTSHDLPSQALHGLWVDEANRTVWVEGDPKMLTPQETDIMLYLWRHARELCTRESILKEALNEPIEGRPGELKAAESRLNSAMTRLRQKIEPNPNRPKYIITIRGQGYKLLL